MIHHFGFVVSDFVRSMPLYDACLLPLGIKRTETDLDWAIYAPESGMPFIWIGSEIPSYWKSSHQAGQAPFHFALSAQSREAVDRFYSQALEYGAEDNGPPGPRTGYGQYYSAYILDLDGNNIEATFREA
ncbi:VOC family protein [Massilia endophytica]|uniref:VOC family protein n=1 Tax=Massilia endophytica TaxID=2899220 RepID=UPI001E348C88|nr:VOC family protein [Massilia endophytica]UGQ46336.1 VOC family protein [Massilia endophytica]